MAAADLAASSEPEGTDILAARHDEGCVTRMQAVQASGYPLPAKSRTRRPPPDRVHLIDERLAGHRSVQGATVHEWVASTTGHGDAAVPTASQAKRCDHGGGHYPWRRTVVRSFCDTSKDINTTEYFRRRKQQRQKGSRIQQICAYDSGFRATVPQSGPGCENQTVSIHRTLR